MSGYWLFWFQEVASTNSLFSGDLNSTQDFADMFTTFSGLLSMKTDLSDYYIGQGLYFFDVKLLG